MPLGFLNFTELWPFLQSRLEIKMGLRSLPRYIPENFRIWELAETVYCVVFLPYFLRV